MKYIILDRSATECDIALISHSTSERELLENAWANPEKFQNALLSHCQKALEVCIDRDASPVEVLESSSFPSSVKLSYRIKNNS